MSFGSIEPDAFEWLTRPHEPGEPARHVAELSDRIGLLNTRANVWRYEPRATGRRHRHLEQEETFVVLAGTLTIYLGEPPERLDIGTGGEPPACIPAGPWRVVEGLARKTRHSLRGRPRRRGRCDTLLWV